MKVVVVGGAGFVGSHAAEFYARKGDEVFVFDNLSRGKLLHKEIRNLDYNWNYLKNLDQKITLVNGDIRKPGQITEICKDAGMIIHAAAQTAVTVSLDDPRSDFSVNAVGTFNVLEAARINDVKTVIYCSTNKVYGENVNDIKIKESQTRYSFDEGFEHGVPEKFPTDLCKHTPYGCSKLAGDLYTQEYGRLYGLKTGVFRMSCIYGTRQFGVEDQGWVAWFTIASILGKDITMYGDGKQVRDILFVSDLISLFSKFASSKLKHEVFSAGGGPENTISLIELINLLEKLNGRKLKVKYSQWRPSDQKVFVSDTRKAEKILDWKPKCAPNEGVKKIYKWALENKNII